MRILDRYILFAFMVDFFTMGLLIVGLVTLGDTAMHFDELLEDADAMEFLSKTGTYVFATLLVLFVSMAPILTLVAAMLTLSSFARTKEIVAMRASGISPFRISLPIFLVSMAVSLAMFFVTEVYMPRHSGAILEALSMGKGRSDEELRQLCVDGSGNVFYFEKFAPRDGSFHHAWIDRRDPATGEWAGRIFAKSGNWIGSRGEGGLLLKNGSEYPARPSEQRATLFSELAFDTDLLPIDVESPGARLRFESIAELRRKALAGSTQRDRLVLQINSRIAHYLFTNWVLLLIALPLALRVGDSGRWTAIVLTVVIIAIFLGVHQTCISLGERAQIPPLVAAWFPVALFGSVGVCMFANAQG